jgi:DNA polymerase III subunit epsilon
MSTVLIWDLETSDMPKWDRPSDSPDQPHIVQAAAFLMDEDTGEEIDRYIRMVKPDGWRIQPGAAAAHGITDEIAKANGVPEASVVNDLLAMFGEAEIAAGFNQPFDIRILRCALMRILHWPRERCDAWQTHLTKFDVMQAAAPHAKIPPTDKMMAAGRKTWKNPSLTEAVAAILGTPMTGAHDAHADAVWTTKLYFWIRELPEPKFRPDVQGETAKC